MKISESLRKNGELVIKIPALKSNPIENRRNESIPKGEKKMSKTLKFTFSNLFTKKISIFFEEQLT